MSGPPIPRTDSPPPFAAVRSESEPMPDPRRELVTSPEGRRAQDTGAWPTMPVTTADAGPRIERLERHVVRLERRVGAAAIPAEGLESSGMYRTLERGFDDIDRRLDRQDRAMEAMDKKLDPVVERAAAGERRKATTADIILSWVKGAGLAAILALVAFLLAHFRWKDTP